MSKHTPGPWNIVEDRVPSSLEVFGGGVAIAELWRRADIEKEKADAYLISAAPELLEALESIVFKDIEAFNEDGFAKVSFYILKKGADAIAKARGEA